MKHFYTLDDLQDWSAVTRALDMPIRLGVIGDPVVHSRSPEMHNAALRSLQMPMGYARFQIAAPQLGDALQRMARLDFIGVNLTVPHKVAALALVGDLDETATRVGAVNTIVFGEAGSRGFNTDGAGISRAVEEAFGRSLGSFRVLVLGAGGAARAIAAQCVREQSPHLALWNRTVRAAHDLRSAIIGGEQPTRVEVVEGDRGALASACARAELIINATSVGLRADDAALLSRAEIHDGQCVYDTIYQPPQTALLHEAKAAGARTANGLSMLLHQGAAAFELWFDRPAPTEVMRRALG